MTDPNRDQNTSPTEPAEGERDDAAPGGTPGWQNPSGTSPRDTWHGTTWQGDRIETDESADLDETASDEAAATHQEQGTGPNL